jgi:site-specific DNA-methyltransferase (adenine-specific)
MTSTTENRDCMEAMLTFPDKYFDLAIVDPPYGLGIRLSDGRGKLKNASMAKLYRGKDWDVTPEPEYWSELFRISKNQIVCGANYFIDYLHNSRGVICWDKEHRMHSLSHFELIWTSFDVPAKIFTKQSNDNSRFHPTQKPVALYKWLLQNYAKQGDKILDTHLGSGSSRIAAHDMGFDFWGYELDAEYFEKQEQRFRAHISKPVLFQPHEMHATGTLF